MTKSRAKRTNRRRWRRKLRRSPGPQNTRTIEIERFIPAGQIDARYFEKPYYIVPRGEVSQELFAVIRDAMSREGALGVTRHLSRMI